MSDTQAKFLTQYRNATRDAELGLASCRVCKRQGPFADFITVLYGGGVMYALCTHCAALGNEVRVARGPRGIEVHGRSTGGATLLGGLNGSSDGVGALTKRVV